MPPSPFVLEASRENFNQLVLGNSDKGPVMVHFWTPKAGPCMLLNPRLIKLVTGYGGKCLLVLANTDEMGQIAHQYGVTSVPTVKFFRHGKVVHTIHGAEPDAAFHKALERFIARDVDVAHVRALEAQRRGDFQTARMQLVDAALADPANPRIPADLAKLLMSQSEYRPARDLLKALPIALRDDAEISRLLTHLDFILAAHDAPPADELTQRIASSPDDLEARYQLAAVQLVSDELESAMAQLLEIAQRGRGFRDDIGRRGLVALFDMLGTEHALTARFRPLLASALDQAGRTMRD
jgi:putative thioredoxin